MSNELDIETADALEAVGLDRLAYGVVSYGNVAGRLVDIGYGHGAAVERDLIVSWLRQAPAAWLQELASQIEDGDHLYEEGET